jgi:hypothetical protein
MANGLSDEARSTLLIVARTMLPHDDLPDEAYGAVVAKLDAEARGDDGVRATLEDAAAGLGPAFAELGDDERLEALRGLEGTPMFGLVHATAIVELYDQPLVWRAFGYEGPSVHLGGYVDRGFDDLDWLPEPQMTFDRQSPPPVGPRVRQPIDS